MMPFRPLARLNARHWLTLSGVLCACAILFGSGVFAVREQQQALAADMAQGRRAALALGGHVGAVLAVIDSAADFVGQAPGRPALDGALMLAPPLRSLSILDPDGRVLFSSSAAMLGHRFAPHMAGFAVLRGPPGLASATGEGLAFARPMLWHGARVTLLAMPDPASLFPEYASGPDAGAGFAALLDRQGHVLAASAASPFLFDREYADLLARLPEGGADGPLRCAQAGGDACLLSLRQLPLLAVGGAGSRRAPAGGQWLGLAAGLLLLLLSAAWWRLLRQREQVELELKSAREGGELAHAARAAFLSTLSHEIRTPMNAVIGMSGLLRETRLDAEQGEFAKAIGDSAGALMAIIDEILDFSRIDAGKLELESVDCDLLAIVEDSLDALASKGREKGLSLMSYVEPGLPLTLAGDPARLRQILLKLIGNGIKFTASGELAVSVRSLGRRQDNCLLRFEVADTGIGIDAATQAKLFTPFTQADSSATRQYGGTGLGLSICKRLVESMGGTIGVDSVPGTGATFWFELALPVRAAAPVALRHPRTASRILMVQPQRRQAAILRDYALSWGIEVSVADSAAQALQRHQPGGGQQVIAIAAALPDMAPEALRAALSARDPGLRFVLLGEPAPGFHALLTQPVRKSAWLAALALERRVVQAPAAARPRHEGKLILLVEDNILNQKVAQRQLNLLGYTADTVNNGREAMDALATSAYGLVLMDCQMPVMDGFEATRQIRKTELSSGAHIQIVAMTANAMRGDRELCLEAGMDDYLAKPILREQLGALLAQRLPQNQAPATVDAPLMLNMQHLRDMFGDQRSLQRDMLERFVANTRPLFEQFELAMERRDFAGVRTLAHRLDGACAHVGIEALAELTRAAVRACHGANLQQLQQVHQAMRAELARLDDFVKRFNARDEAGVA